jgi:[ribosomal protein S5]-alanine N-acetyltransferase
LPSADIGFAMFPAFKMQGYGAEAAFATMHFAKNTLQLSPILGITLADNVASIKLLEKVGLQYIEMITLHNDALMLFSDAGQ